LEAATQELGPYPDLRIATELWKRHGVNSLCDVYPFAGEFDQYDPYWWLGCINGQWYLADASEVPLVTVEETGAGLKLVRQVKVPGSPAAA
jgi:hypothetical protein